MQCSLRRRAECGNQRVEVWKCRLGGHAPEDAPGEPLACPIFQQDFLVASSVLYVCPDAAIPYWPIV